jgi:hypothetical protein
MGNAAPEEFGPRIPQETAAQQCLIRDANEATETLNAALAVTAARLEFRCECGDPLCQARLALTSPEYEGVRSCGSHFVIAVNHENPQSAWVLREHARYAVIDVVAGEERYQVLARNPRHAWVDARERTSR